MLRFGDLSVRTFLWELRTVPAQLRKPLVRRLFWRDMAYAELYHNPQLPSQSVRPLPAPLTTEVRMIEGGWQSE